MQVQNVENKSPLYAKIGRTDNESPQGNALCRFSYSLDGKVFVPLGGPFGATPGHWVGAKLGLFALAPPGAARAGHVDSDWFRVSSPGL